MNRCSINGARKPPRIGSLAMISGALLGTLGAVGPALSADLPFSDTPYQQPGYYPDWHHCDHCRQWGPEGRMGAPGYEPFPPMAERFPPERRWVPRDYAEPRYPMGGPYSPYAQYRDGPYRSHRYSSYYPGPDAQADPYEGYGPLPPEPRRRFGDGGFPYPPAPFEPRRRFGDGEFPYPPAPIEPRRRFGDGAVPYPPAPIEPRRRFGDGGFPYPPAPAAYEYRPERHGPYRHEAMAPPYDYRDYGPPYQYRPAYEYEPSERPPAPVPGGQYGPGDPE
jgi:hypothetical protein